MFISVACILLIVSGGNERLSCWRHAPTITFSLTPLHRMPQIPALLALAFDPDVSITGAQNYTSIYEWVVALSQDELNGIGQSYHRQVGDVQQWDQTVILPPGRRSAAISPLQVLPMYYLYL